MRNPDQSCVAPRPMARRRLLRALACVGVLTTACSDSGAVVAPLAEPVVSPNAASAARLSFSLIGTGSFNSCGLTPTSAAYCWGTNLFGELGTGSTEAPDRCHGLPCSGSPIPVTGGLSFTQLGVGDRTACGTDSGGVAYCWGSNIYGQLGVGTAAGPEDCSGYPCSTLPVAVSGGLTFASIQGGSSHVCAVTGTGAAYCWGSNDAGQLGIGVPGPESCSPSFFLPCSTVPLPVVGGLTFEALSAGGHTCGVTPNGAAYCWGGNLVGQLGLGFANPIVDVPQAVAGGLVFSTVTAGGDHSCGLTASGSAYCWGQNDIGQLGIGTTTGPEICLGFIPCSTAPVPVLGSLTFNAISAGFKHTCATASTGVGYCWGEGFDGQLGNGMRHAVDNPVALVGGRTFVAVSAGDGHTCALTPSGAGYCWGVNRDGQLGIAEPVPRWLIPARVAAPSH